MNQAATAARARFPAPPGFATLQRELRTQLADIGRRFRRAALASSLSAEDMVLTHAIVAGGAPIEVFVIDTGRLHAQTLELLERARRRYALEIQVLRPDPAAVEAYVAAHGLNGFYESVELRHRCCHIRKVEPLERALAGRDAWLTGQRRAHSAARAQLAPVELDAARGISKFNPLALWSDAAVWHYIERHQVPYNALHDRGYPSIGCEPCTRAIKPGEDPRAGRWWWENGAKKECGLHSSLHSGAVSSQADVGAANVKASDEDAGRRQNRTNNECGLHVAAPTSIQVATLARTLAGKTEAL